MVPPRESLYKEDKLQKHLEARKKYMDRGVVDETVTRPRSTRTLRPPATVDEDEDLTEAQKMRLRIQ